MQFNANIDYISRKNQYNIWYVVKQDMDFSKVCEAVKVLEEYQKLKPKMTLKEFMSDKITSNYRILGVARIYGLIRKKNINCFKEGYKDCMITDVYYEIKKRCNNDFKKVENYYDILEQQIEKIYISSILDEKFNSYRKECRLYPLFILYKVLIEIGRVYGEYKISYDEFICFLSTTNKYSDYSKALYNIFVTRDSSINTRFDIKFKSLNTREDLRYHLILKNLKHFNIDVDNNIVELDKKYIYYIQSKIFKFENIYYKNIINIDDHNQEVYLNNLCSNKSIFNLY